MGLRIEKIATKLTDLRLKKLLIVYVCINKFDLPSSVIKTYFHFILSPFPAVIFVFAY